MSLLLSIFCSLLVLANADPQIIYLNKFNAAKGGSFSVEIGANLYLASNDDTTLLKNIRITSGTFSDTLNNINGATTKIWTASTLVIKSDNSEVQASSVTGFLYITTASQAKDDTFSVIVVNGEQKMSRTGANSTTVILNTQVVDDFPPFDSPDKTTFVTGIEQLSHTDLNFHYGIPAENWTSVTINQFFENPQIIDYYDDHFKIFNKTRIFFTTVEPLQINLPYWYITSNGPYNMVLDSRYMDIHIQNTTSENSTGLIMNSDVLMEHYVFFQGNPARRRNFGYLLSTFLDYTVNFIMYAENSLSFQSFGKNQKFVHGQSITEMAVTYLKVNSTSLKPGTFYFQYFVYSGDYLPVSTTTTTTPTTTVPSTSTTVMTTTSTAESFSIPLFYLLISLILI